MTGDLDGDWRALYDAATAFRKLAPWKWMLDRDIFGVRDPRTGAIGWCAVLGAAGEFFGLAVYRGDRGFDLHRRIHADPLAARDEAVWGQDALVLMFVDRADVPREERDRIRRLGLSFHGRCAWPQVESHAPGRRPLPIEPDEIGWLVDVIIQARAVAGRFREDDRCLEPDEEGRLLVRTLRDRANGTDWSDERVAEPAHPPIDVPDVDQVRLERMRAELRPVAADVECAVFPMEGIVDDEDVPPYVPAMFMLADSKSGTILDLKIGHPLQRDELAKRELLTSIEKLSGIPRRVRVADERVERVLAPIARGLGIQLKRVDELPAIENARASLIAHLAPPHARIR